MIFNIKLVKISTEYCDYLRKFDSKVPYNKGEKELRPFVGILFTIKDCEYFAPLSSPKSKHLEMKNTSDFYKIKNGELGAVNFNNMIPVMKSNYEIIYFSEVVCKSAKEFKYYNMLKKQVDWLNKNYNTVRYKAFKLFESYNSGKVNEKISARCCNFKLLEEKCLEYNTLKVK